MEQNTDETNYELNDSKDCLKQLQTVFEMGRRVCASVVLLLVLREDIFVEWGNSGQSFLLRGSLFRVSIQGCMASVKACRGWLRLALGYRGWMHWRECAQKDRSTRMYKRLKQDKVAITEKQLNEKMFSTRSFNETPSAHGRRPAVFWSQSVLQLQGSPSAAQTTRERWEASAHTSPKSSAFSNNSCKKKQTNTILNS